MIEVEHLADAGISTYDCFRCRGRKPLAHIDEPRRERHRRLPDRSDTLDQASGRGRPAARGKMVMRNVSFAVLATAALLASPAAHAADADVLRKFGMQGRVALNCSAPYSQSNPHVIYGVSPQGAITRTLRMTPDLDGTFPMRTCAC